MILFSRISRKREREHLECLAEKWREAAKQWEETAGAWRKAYEMHMASCGDHART